MQVTRNPTRLICSIGLVILVAGCGSVAALVGIETLGKGFVNAFNQGPNDAPVDPDTITLVLTPLIEPFDP